MIWGLGNRQATLDVEDFDHIDEQKEKNDLHPDHQVQKSLMIIIMIIIIIIIIVLYFGVGNCYY